MKQIFYKGLLALTIAFGFTSCDKNDVGSENLQMTQSEVKAGLASKVTFSQDGVGISVPKLKGSESSKTHVGYAHIYSSQPQVLSIVNADGIEQYTGSYAANDISTINPASILLENGVGYTATSSNVSNTGLGVVSPFLPYTSTVDFDLSESGQIVLAATLERGFLIVNGEAEADDLNRISGVTANDVALIKDTDGDFYGYLLAGSHEIIISYTRDGGTSTTVDTVDVAIGTAYTVETGLLDESPDVVDSTVSTSTGTALESEIGPEGAGRDINTDDDLFDSLERIVTSTQATLNGDNVGDAVDTYGSWSVVSDLDVDVDVSSEESTEADYESSVNADGDLFDTIIRVVTTTTTSVNDVVTDTDIDNGDWTILADHSELTVGQSGTGTGVPVDADADGFNADVDLNDNDDTIGDQAAEDAKAQAAQDELDRIAQEAADAQAEIDRLAQVEADRLAQVEADRVAAEEAAAAAAAALAAQAELDRIAAARPDTIVFGAWVGDAPAARLVAGTSGITTEVAGSSVASVTQTTTTPQTSVVDAYDQTREYTVTQVGDLDDPAPVADAADLVQTIAADSSTAADLVVMVEIANPAYIDPNAPAEGITATVNLGGVTVEGGTVQIYLTEGEVLQGEATVSGTRNIEFEFEFAAAGTYYAKYYKSLAAIATNAPTYVDFSVAADGSVVIITN